MLFIVHAVLENKSHMSSFKTPQLSYTTFGFNDFNYRQYWRTYTDADKLCSNFIRDVKLFPQENGGLIDEIYYLCTYQ